MMNISGNDVRLSGDGYATNMWIPSVEEESCNGIREISLQTKHFTNRRLFLTGEVTENMADNFVSSMLYLAQTDEPIYIYIDSPGGSVRAGLVIYDVIQSLEDKVPIYMHCIGNAASMGAVILAGGQKGRRYILPNSKTMIHEPLLASGMGATSATAIKKTADSILETKAIINGILAKHTGRTLEEINEATSFDNFLNAEESVEFGLVDEIKGLF